MVRPGIISVGNRGEYLVSPLQGGAAYSPSNLVASCPNCNARRGDRLEKALHRGIFLGNGQAGRREGRIPDTLGDGAVYGGIREA